MPLLSSCAGLCLIAAATAPTPVLVPVDAAQAEPHALGEIVVLGRRGSPHDHTLGVGAITERMSPSSRSIESDLLRAVRSEEHTSELQSH